MLAHSPGFAEPIGGGKPTWTILECGWGNAGLSPDRLAAFWWRYGRDCQSGVVLRRILHHEALRLARREHWPTTIDGQHYVRDLADIVLFEDQMSELERDRLQRLMKLHWGEDVWVRVLMPKHRAIGAQLDRLVVDAHEHIARRIREHDDD